MIVNTHYTYNKTPISTQPRPTPPNPDSTPTLNLTPFSTQLPPPPTRSVMPLRIPEEEPDEVDSSHVTLDKYLCDLNLVVNKVCQYI